MQTQLAERIAETTESQFSALVGSRPCSGGSIHDATCITLADGRSYFVKSSSNGAEVFAAEAAGLRELEDAQILRTPKIVYQGTAAGNTECLILEFVESTSPGPAFFEEFGTLLAQLHRQTEREQCGWRMDNFIGATPQPNPLGTDWVAFFAESRLRHQLRLATKQKLACAELVERVDRMCDRLDKLIGSPAEKPCLLHGDLWSGNFLSDTDGHPVILDPAVYYGRREAELAMPLLFGGFPRLFFEAYSATWPLEDGWQDRVEVYKLYHLLNHLNLFGSGYLGSCLEIARRFA